jgi:hypothetical protein
MVYKKNLPPQLQNYEMVEDRLKRFWEECPNGRIDTEVIQVLMDGAMIMIKAYLYESKEDEKPVATGIALDWKGKGNNMSTKTNWCEVAETSAIGRAIANSRFQSKKALRPSREEMEVALGRQKNTDKNTPAKVEIEETEKEKQQPEVDKFYEEVSEESVPESDLKEVDFRNFCEKLVKDGKMDSKIRDKFFMYIDENIESLGFKGLDLAIHYAKEMDFMFVYGQNIDKPDTKQLKQTSLVSEDKVFETFEEFVKWKKDTYREKMIALNPDVESSDVRLLLNVAYREGQALKVGRKNYQEGVEYWNKNIKGKPYSIKEKENQDLDLKNIPIVSPKDIPSMMEDAGISGDLQDSFEDFPKLVKKITYKNPEYQSSAKQQELILKCCKFRNIEPERLTKYLEQELKTSLKDLTIQEASWLIDGFFGEKKKKY